MIKLIASDMDGTLLNGDHVVSETNLEAIKEAQKKGVTFMIATGRDYSSIGQIMKDQGFRCPCILMNGAELRTAEGEVVKRITMEKGMLKQAVDILKPYGLLINYMTGNEILVTHSKEEVYQNYIERARFYSPERTEEERVKYVEEAGFFNQVKQIETTDYLFRDDVYVNKIETFCKDVSKVQEINEKLRKIDGVAVASAGVYSIEVTDERAQKGFTLAEYIKELGIEKEEVAVFGDSDNDYSLFSEFSYTYAPRNAVAGIKEMAYKVIPSNLEDGVGKEIQSILRQQ